MWNTFNDSGITFKFDGGRLKVEGLSKLPGNRADDIRQQIRENKNEIIMAVQCPARCKNTGFCYGLAYFEGKPGKHWDCSFLDCRFEQCRKSIFRIPDNKTLEERDRSIVVNDHNKPDKEAKG